MVWLPASSPCYHRHLFNTEICQCHLSPPPTPVLKPSVAPHCFQNKDQNYESDPLFPAWSGSLPTSHLCASCSISLEHTSLQLSQVYPVVPQIPAQASIAHTGCPLPTASITLEIRNLNIYSENHSPSEPLSQLVIMSSFFCDYQFIKSISLWMPLLIT